MAVRCCSRLLCSYWRNWGTRKEMVDSHTASYNVPQLEFWSRESGLWVSLLTTLVPTSGPIGLLTSGSHYTACLSESLHLTQSSSYIPTFLNLAFIPRKKKEVILVLGWNPIPLNAWQDYSKNHYNTDYYYHCWRVFVPPCEALTGMGT